VLFGDAFLLSIPDKRANGQAVTRHVLVDVGNAASGEQGSNDVFEPVIDDILDVLDGRSLDLYIMTHEHMDHVQGLPYAARDLDKELTVDYAWLTKSAHEDYYDDYPDAKRHFDALVAAYEAVQRSLAALPDAYRKELTGLLEVNNPHRTGECVDYLRNLTAANRTHYVYRGCSLTGTHPFRDASFKIWAPEEDTSEYYGHFRPITRAVSGQGPSKQMMRERPTPPPGVDAGAFYNLVEKRRNSVFDNLLTIDKARNNTSVVFSLEWQGWKLLFTGDAEVRSWKTMQKYNALESVHFLKVSHHGSENGTPYEELLDEILPLPGPTDVERCAVVSTGVGAYNGVPCTETLNDLSQRCTIYRTDDEVAPGEAFDLEFSSS